MGDSTHDDDDEAILVWVARWIKVSDTQDSPSLDSFLAQVPEQDRERVRTQCIEVGVARSLFRSANADSPILVGRVLDDFTVGEEIGRGGMAVVHRARQRSLGRDVALKILTGLRGRSADSVHRFSVEAMATARTDDPRIVKVFAVGEAEGLRYLAMELVSGHSLYDEFRGRRGERDAPTPTLPAPDTEGACRKIAAFFAEVCEAIESAHAVGVIHRDIQPKNILIDRRGAPKLIDFGLARLLDEPGVTKTGVVLGTAYYMSPEQVRSLKATVDGRTDIYSLGVVIYQALTGRPPFDGTTSQQVMEKIVRSEPQRADAINPRVPLDLAAICERALAKRADWRFQTAAEFAAALRDASTPNGSELRPAGPVQRVTQRLMWRPLPAITLGLVLVGVAIGIAIEMPRRPWTEVSFVSAGGPNSTAGAEIWIQAIRPIDWTFDDAWRLGVVPSRSKLQPGLYRVTLRNGDQFAELTIDATRPTAPVIVPDVPLRTPSEVREGMVEIGPASVPSAGQIAFLVPEPQGPYPQAAYLIDRYEVTNAQYRDFVLATDAKPPILWPPEWRTQWDAKWDRLPVTGITCTAAVAYATWAGKRLPTDREWRLAATGVDAQVLPWSATFDADSISQRARVGYSEVGESAPIEELRESYLAGVAPADSHPDGRSPFGLHHTLGNAREWVDRRVLDSRRDEGGRLDTATTLAHGLAWHDQVVAAKGVTHPYVVPRDYPYSHIGFRCAKSLRPPGSAR
ncbi:MAG: bifunctional serine/threonine-protein kinase/formylglycine-generating enzyme family protein [Planctomycetota bacterium]